MLHTAQMESNRIKVLALNLMSVAFAVLVGTGSEKVPLIGKSWAFISAPFLEAPVY